MRIPEPTRTGAARTLKVSCYQLSVCYVNRLCAVYFKSKPLLFSIQLFNKPDLKPLQELHTSSKSFHVMRSLQEHEILYRFLLNLMLPESPSSTVDADTGGPFSPGQRLQKVAATEPDIMYRWLVKKLDCLTWASDRELICTVRRALKSKSTVGLCPLRV